MVACPQQVRARHVGRRARRPLPAAHRRLGTEQAGRAQLYGLHNIKGNLDSALGQHDEEHRTCRGRCSAMVRTAHELSTWRAWQ